MGKRVYIFHKIADDYQRNIIWLADNAECTLIASASRSNLKDLRERRISQPTPQRYPKMIRRE